MKTDMIYSSPLERAVQTGEIVTGLKRDRNGGLKSLVIRVVLFWPRKVFERLDSHVMDLFR